MASIDHLPNPRFSKLSHAERIEIIVGVRAARRTPTAKPSAPRAKRQAKSGSPMDKQLDKLTPDQIQMLLEALDHGN